MLLADLATLAASLFTGAASYVLFVEHPARLLCPTAHAVEQWRPSHRRATVMQVTLAVTGTVLAIAAWLGGSGLSWLLAGLLLGLALPFTLIIMRSTNQRLDDPSLDLASDQARGLLVRWGQYQTIRTGLSVVALLLMLFGHG
jgi:hypothetical protein